MHPRFRPQLTGAPTESVDCGVIATIDMVDWATRGVKQLGVKSARRRMGLSATRPVTTDPQQWARAIRSYDTPAELGGRYERLTCSLVDWGDWSVVTQHLSSKLAAILVVDYGVLRRLAPRKTGSLSFDGLHAIFVKAGSATLTHDYDSLLDGRYSGCPRGPVDMPLDKLRRASEAVGSALGHPGKVLALLGDRATVLGSGVEPLEEDDAPTLTGLLADLVELQDELADIRLQAAIDDLSAILGPYTGEADPADDAIAGVASEIDEDAGDTTHDAEGGP